jgi:hypothetical protein
MEIGRIEPRFSCRRCLARVAVGATATASLTPLHLFPADLGALAGQFNGETRPLEIRFGSDKARARSAAARGDGEGARGRGGLNDGARARTPDWEFRRELTSLGVTKFQDQLVMEAIGVDSLSLSHTPFFLYFRFLSLRFVSFSFVSFCFVFSVKIKGLAVRSLE